MPFQHSDGLRYFTFDAFSAAGVCHGIFTRQGGASPAPWQSLNVGGGVGDEREHVISNRIAIFNCLGRDVDSLFDAWQIHSANVLFAEAPRPKDQPYQYADILITDRPEVTLFMRFADCVPILLADPSRGVVCIAHAGWKGTIKQVAGVAAAALCARFGARPTGLIAAIGPSICTEHYPVGPEVAAAVRESFGLDASRLLIQDGDTIHFDLWAANRASLERVGVEDIHTVGICTLENPADWFSHRGEHGKTGRFGALIALEGGGI